MADIYSIKGSYNIFDSAAAAHALAQNTSQRMPQRVVWICEYTTQSGVTRWAVAHGDSAADLTPYLPSDFTIICSYRESVPAFHNGAS